MKIIFLLIVIGLSGCDINEDWQSAAQNYKCTTEQMERVKSEAVWCKQHTDYFNTYCYGTAIIRNCEKMKKD